MGKPFLPIEFVVLVGEGKREKGCCSKQCSLVPTSGLNLISKNQIQTACWAVPKPLVFCIRWMQAAHFLQNAFLI